MATACSLTVDSQGRELATHGSASFPLSIYNDNLNQFSVEWHWHEEWEFIFSIEGKITACAGQTKIELEAGQGMFVNSAVLHGVWSADSEISNIHSIVFHPRLLGSTDSIFWINYLYPFCKNVSTECLIFSEDTPWQKECLELLETAWKATEQQEHFANWKTRSLLEQVFLLMYEHNKKTDYVLSDNQLKNDRRIKQMLSFIHENYSGEITADEIASSASISVSEALRCFKKTIGIPPVKYLLQYRLDHAALLLADTDKKANQIGEECGFSDMSYFTRRFKEYKGVTPLEYRKGHS